jgi:hypothetical protein
MRACGIKVIAAFLSAVAVITTCRLDAASVTIDAATMKDKIKGGWIGQTVGVCYGGPTEFRYTGSLIPDRVPIEYNRDILLEYFNNDDIYMDLSFLAVFDSLGLDASSDALALKFANAGFALWHANQAARWNIQHGIMPPASGHWKNNPHADDIDFQIEADFIGMMTPAMPNTAFEYCDRVGHIMNYGDGFYGGVFVAAMYSHAFVEDDVTRIVELAVQSLPEGSLYYQVIADVLRWKREFPDDWKQCWFEVAKKWDWDVGCPSGALQSFNIDAKINGAYIAIGLLYGEGDFGRTMEIATRCGQDSDCNPSNAAGILGTMMGYSNIPQRWKTGLDEIMDRKLDYCDYSLADACEVTYELAAELVERNAGAVTESGWRIERQQPVPPGEVEICFEGLELDKLNWFGNRGLDSYPVIEFTGRGCMIQASIRGGEGRAVCEFYIDGELVEKVEFLGDYHDRRDPFFWNYDLEPGEHKLEIRQVGGDGEIALSRIVTYR